ncbi:MAG: hypothetical protein HYY22_07815 [Thaumarchaeota archaeon]|nr:hypothetical protein [Nitrososphaerota archaeon]
MEKLKPPITSNRDHQGSICMNPECPAYQMYFDPASIRRELDIHFCVAKEDTFELSDKVDRIAEILRDIEELRRIEKQLTALHRHREARRLRGDTS